MNITILDYHISYISYITQLPSMSPIEDQFATDARRNVYVVAIYNEDPLSVSTTVQLLRDKQKRDRLSYLTPTLTWRHPSTIILLEGNCDFFYHSHPLLEPNIYHHEILYNISQ